MSPRQWRSVEELAARPDFMSFVAQEFPSLPPDAATRRSVLKAMAASFALAGLAGCDAAPDETAVPWTEAPEFVVPGVSRWYATAITFAGYALPVLGKTEVGRPVKLEGNPDHPATRGATDPFLQAALLGLYDPNRSQAPRRGGRPASWDEADAAVAEAVRAIDATHGEGFRLLTGSLTSPTLLRQLAAMAERWPGMRWHVTEPAADDLRREGARRAFGRPLDTHLRLARAEVIVCIDDDPLGPGPRQAVHGRRWAERRRAFQRGEGGARLLVAEPTPTLTGTMAEDRLIAAHGRAPALLAALGAALGLDEADAALSDRERAWIEAAAAALAGAPGRALLTLGPQHPPELHAYAFAIAGRIGSIGATLGFTEPVAPTPPDGPDSFATLARDLREGRVTALAMIGVNPAYAAPRDLDIAGGLAAVPFSLHAGLHLDETAALCRWHLPLAHELESWGDARAVDGTASIQQPLVRPLGTARAPAAMLASLAGAPAEARAPVEATWRSAWGDGFDARWRDALVRGFVADSTLPEVVPRRDAVAAPPSSPPPDPGTTLVLRPDPTVWDGRFSENAWLQETPKPITKITWGNAFLIAPALAAAQGLANGDEVEVAVDDLHRVTGPVWIVPGQEASTVVASFGYGRRAAGSLAEGRGYDAFALVRPDRPWHAQGLSIRPTGKRAAVATTQAHQAMDGFDFVRTVDAADPVLREPPARAAPTFYPARRWERPSWGMSIDLDLCIGCNACVVACVAENNVPMVGPELVAEGREMHWLRVDRYHAGDPDEPRGFFQPVPCMHCEEAPCEMGCPVNAAVHSADGLNLQVYNRCIGTRTCSSYCPYKVRRFNWFDFTADDPETVRAMRNPDVTVRQRGVMEKCTYCVQRISAARITAKKAGRAIADGEVVTACQQACPSQAIVFGDVLDPESAVARRKAGGRDYALLPEANTRPRTTYLARIGKATA